jgi:hypothetical protein
MKICYGYSVRRLLELSEMITTVTGALGTSTYVCACAYQRAVHTLKGITDGTETQSFNELLDRDLYFYFVLTFNISFSETFA